MQSEHSYDFKTRQDMSAMFDALFVPAAKVDANAHQSMPEGRRAHSPSKTELVDNSKASRIMHIPRPLKASGEVIAFSDLQGYRVSFLRVINSHLPVQQILRLLYCAGEGAWLVGMHDEIVACLFSSIDGFPKLQRCLREGVLTSQGIIVEASPPVSLTLDKAVLSSVLMWSFIFELNRTMGWIPIGKCGNILSIRDIITTPLRTSEKPHRNVPVLEINPADSIFGFSVKLQVFKYFPLIPGAPQTSLEGSQVVVLPNLSTGRLWKSERSGPGTFHERPRELEKYWNMHHGYHLSSATAMSGVSVSFGDEDMRFTYPSVCVWRHDWTHIPSYTREYYPAMRARLEQETSRTLEMWRERSGLIIEIATTVDSAFPHLAAATARKRPRPL